MQSSFPVDRYPGPVCGYAIGEGTPVLRDANPAFERRFGPVESGVSVSETLEEYVVEETDLGALLTSSSQFTVSLDSTDESAGRYHVQSVPPVEGDSGFLIFTQENGERGDSDSETLGINHVASVISHDLRNPLDVAKARLRAAREDGDEEHFDHIAKAHRRMERIIQDVLTLTGSREVVDPDEEIDLESVTVRAWGTVETDDAFLEVDGSLPTVVADPDQVGRLFENLFRNAVEHGSTNRSPQASNTDTQESDPPHSQDAMEVQRESKSEDGLTVRVGELEDANGFFVADDGQGIPESKRDRVLKPGYSSDDHGTGLGLAIVEKIADAHDWEVRIDATDEGGARIEIGDF